MYPDGLCRLDDTTWSRCIEFEDVNYQLAGQDDQTAIFEALCDMYIMTTRLSDMTDKNRPGEAAAETE